VEVDLPKVLKLPSVKSDVRFRFLLLPYLGAMACLIAACSSIEPHQNFVEIVSKNVGKSVGEDQRHGMAPERFVQSKTLSNGVLEREYEFRGSCRLFFSVDPSTNIVVSWRYEGSNMDCAVTP
jgi:hypothetical protein